MTKMIIVLASVLALLGCQQEQEPRLIGTVPITDRTRHAYEDGLRTGHADAKTFGHCDHPFPRKELPFGYGTLYLSRFEEGYFKGCALARKSSVAVPKKKVSQSPPRAKAPVTSRCEAPRRQDIPRMMQNSSALTVGV